MTQQHHSNTILFVTSTPGEWSKSIDALTEYGYHVGTAMGGVLALSMLDSHSVHMLIIDDCLDDLSPTEVIRIVRYVHPKSRLPILMIVDTDTAEDYKNNEHLELNDILKKPVNSRELIEKIERATQSRADTPVPTKSSQQDVASTDVEQLMLINKALRLEIQQRERVEQQLRKEMERRKIGQSGRPKSATDSPSSKADSTGLISNTVFNSQLTQLLNMVESGVANHTLCYLQATNLKQFEECYGETAREGLLRHLAKVIHSCIRKDDSITDLGHGEFLILLPHCSVGQADRLMSALCGKTRSYRFIWRDKGLRVDLLTGVVAIAGADVNAVIEAAKAAVAAHVSPQSTGKIGQENVNLSTSLVDTDSAEDLLEAMRNGRFQLYYQPIDSLHRNENSDGVRFELFLRLRDKFGRFIRPAAFLPAVERFELISKLDRWTISTALTWLAAHMTVKFNRLTLCCINLSGQSLSDDTLREFIQKKFSETGIPPHKICLEINETAAIENIANASEFMSELGKSGCSFALDDFGSGMSSMAYMKNLPAEYIKIDGRFVKNISTSNSDLSTVKSINEIAHALGKKTIAEFVEDEAVLKKLKEIGVDFAQGYAIGRPLPIKGLLVESLAASGEI